MAEIAKKVGKALGYGTLGTILTAGITYGITQFADAFSAIPTDTPAMQIVKYATTVGAGVAFAGAAAYQASDGTKWYSITPRGGKGKVSREMQDILESSIGIGHKETLAELLSDLGENAVDNDVAYDVGIKKVEGHDLVYVKKFERGSVTGLTYTKEMSYQIFQLLDAKDVKPREQVDGGANGKAYIELSLKQLQALESYKKDGIKGGKKKPKAKKGAAQAEGDTEHEEPEVKDLEPEPEIEEPESEGLNIGYKPDKTEAAPKAADKQPGTT